MIIRSLDENKDWNFGRGKSDYLTDDAAIMLNIDTRLNEWRNDCFFAQLNGVDWYNGLDKDQKANLDLEIKTIIIESFGVVELVSFSSYVLDRRFRARYNIKTIFSESLPREVII